MNLKRISNISIFIISFFLGIVIVNAKSSVIVTDRGYELTEKQYNNLSKVFSDAKINSLSSEVLDVLKDSENLVQKSDTKYYRVDEWYDPNGNVILSSDREVSKEEALYFQQHRDDFSGSDSHTTQMKQLVLTVTMGAQNVRYVDLTNTWLSIPQTKSYDVIGLRVSSNASYLSNASISGYQNSDGTYYYYNGSSSNTKKSNTKHVGISMNIADSTSYTLVNHMEVVYSVGEAINVYGAYEHAKSNVTLSQSQDYSFSSTGQGSVFKFSNSVNSKYDNMSGVHVVF